MKRKIIAAAFLAAVTAISGFGMTAAALQGDAVIGDVNHDSLVNIEDATAVQRVVAGLEELEEGSTALRLADADGSGECDITDVTAIRQYCAEIASLRFP